MASEDSALERFSRKGRRVMIVLALIVLVIAGGGLWIAFSLGPLQAVAYVVLTSALAGFLFPRFV